MKLLKPSGLGWSMLTKVGCHVSGAPGYMDKPLWQTKSRFGHSYWVDQVSLIHQTLLWRLAILAPSFILSTSRI